MNTLGTTKLAGLTAAAALVLTTGATTAAASARPAGPAIHTAYMNGLDIHTARGRVIHVPLHGRYDAYTTLLGRGPQGWVFIAGNGHYYRVANGQATKLALSDTSDEYVTHKLSDDGGLIWESVFDQGGDVEINATDLTGHGAGEWEVSNNEGEVMAADGDDAWVGGSGGLQELVRKHDDVKSQTLKIDPRWTLLVNSAQDTVFLRDKGGAGPTSLSAPGVLRWHAPRFTPLAISPGGTYVAGLVGRETVEIRRMSDGTLVHDLAPAYHPQDDLELGWDGDGAVLFAVDSHGQEALERCDAATGACAIAGPWSKVRYSLPDSHHEQYGPS